MLGADVETGGVWDPLKLSKDEGQLYRYRAVELKHGTCFVLRGSGLGGELWSRLKRRYHNDWLLTARSPYPNPQIPPPTTTGRLAMLAVLGNWVAELWHPLYDG